MAFFPRFYEGKLLSFSQHTKIDFIDTDIQYCIKLGLNEAHSYSHDLSLLCSEGKQFVTAIDNIVCTGNRFFAAKLYMLLR